MKQGNINIKAAFFGATILLHNTNGKLRATAKIPRLPGVLPPALLP